MSRPIDSLADILAPVTPEAFRTDYFRQRPLHIPGTPDKFDGIMSWDILTGLVNQAGIWSGRSMELALDGARLDPSDYCRPDKDRDNRDSLLVDIDRLGALLRRGASLVLNDIATLVPALHTATAAIESGLEGKVQANLYCSWKAHQGFGSHFDTHDVLALHIAGEKTWRIYGRHFEDPIAHPAFRSLPREFHEAHKGPLTLEVTLRPGDLLYIPRGWYHDALATSDATIHIACGLTSVIGMDLVSMLFERCVADPEFRRSVPGAGEEDGRALERHLAHLGERLSAITRDPAVIEQFRTFVNGYRNPRASLRLPEDAVVRRFRVRNPAIKAVRAGGGWHLTDGKKGVAIPPGMEKPVAWIVDRGRFTETDFASAFSALAASNRTRILDDLLTMKVIENA